MSSGRDNGNFERLIVFGALGTILVILVWEIWINIVEPFLNWVTANILWISIAAVATAGFLLWLWIDEEKVRQEKRRIATQAEMAASSWTPIYQRQTSSGAPRRDYIPREVRRIVWHRAGGKCEDCGGTESLEFDHIIPVAKGGSASLQNLQLLCRRCNRQKSAAI